MLYNEKLLKLVDCVSYELC